MIKLLLLALITFGVACATARDTAVTATNTAQSVLTAVDDAWAPIVQDEIAKHKALDDAAYKQAMAPMLVVQEAIEQARRATQLLNLAVQTWDAQADEGAMWRDVLPCVIRDLQLIRALLHGHEAHAPPELAHALNLVEVSLIALAKPGSACPGKKGTTVFPAEVQP